MPYDGDLDELSVTKKDVQDFLADVNTLLPDMQLKDEDVYYAFTGLYPLVSEEIKTDTYQGTGDYQVVDHSMVDGVEGVISVLGAKYTTGRIVAEKAIDIVLEKLGKPKRKCQTAGTQLLEGKIADLDGFTASKKEQYNDILDAASVEYLVDTYGSEIDTVVKYLSGEKLFLSKLSPDRETFVGEINYAVENEMACTLSDMVFARTGLGTIGHPGADTLLRVAQIMAKKLNWSNEKMLAEIESIETQYSYLN